MRAFGRERLVEADEEVDACGRHLDYFLAIATGTAEELWGGRGQQRALAALDADHDNLRAALAWALARRGPDGLRMAADLVPFWRWRGRHAEGRRWLAEALARAPADASARGRALAGAAILAYDQGDGGAAIALASEAVDLCRRSGDAISCIGL